MEKFALELQEVTKQFPGVLALDKVSLSVEPGTVHALMGENGAGKSTLMKCLFGIYKMDGGKIILNNTERTFSGPADAMHAGISMIHQELSNVPRRSVAQNIWLGREPLTKMGLIDHQKMIADTKTLLEGLNFHFDPKAEMGSLSISQQQGCEIAKAVSYDSSVVVMDEPTSSLTENEVEHLFEIIRRLRETGVAVIYISHKMEEIFKIADCVSVMRDGKNVGTYPIAEIDDNKLIALMVGRENKERFPHVDYNPGEVVLEVKNLTATNPRSFKDVSFQLRKGEILGFGGLVGAQRTELVEAIYGLRGIASGEVYVHGKKIHRFTPENAIAAGIALVTEDRRGAGIVPLMTVTENTTLPSLKRHKTPFGLLDHKTLNAKAVSYNQQLRTKTPTMATKIQNLSGGNQQKVILSRWLMTLPEIFIMDEPTRGIDVGAKFEIYLIMAELVKQGKAIIMVSSEMPELMGMSHRIMVLCNGKQTGILDKAELKSGQFDQEEIMRLAAKFS